jgi:hypothetical protein
VCRIDRDLRGETDSAVGLPRVPFLYGGEQFLRAGAVDGEIVVGEEHGSIAEPVQRIEFAQHQIDRLVPLLAPDILDHIAELALERASARGLDGAHDRPVVGIEIPARERRNPQVDLGADVFGLPAAAAQVGEELRCDVLNLSAHQDVAVRPDRVRAQRRVGPADHHGPAAPAEFRGDALHAAPLADLAGDADKIGRNVEIDRRHVLVTKPDLKIARREPGDGRNREVRHRRGRGKAPGPEHFGAEIARKISERIDEIQGFRHRFASSRPPQSTGCSKNRRKFPVNRR